MIIHDFLLQWKIYKVLSMEELRIKYPGMNFIIILSLTLQAKDVLLP